MSPTLTAFFAVQIVLSYYLRVQDLPKIGAGFGHANTILRRDGSWLCDREWKTLQSRIVRGTYNEAVTYVLYAV